MNKDENPPLPTQRAYRKQYEAFFAPLGRKIANLGISADTLSILNLVFSFLVCVAFIFSSNGNYVFIYVAMFFLIIASFFDMIDGSVARATKEKYPDKEYSKFGAVLDPAIDRYSEALENAEKLMDWSEKKHYPFIYGINPSEINSFLHKYNLELIEDVGTEFYQEKYLRPLNRDMITLDAERTNFSRISK